MLKEADSLFSDIRKIKAQPSQKLCCLCIDAEEDFDWHSPIQGTGFSTECMHRIADLRAVVAAYGLRPAYLLTYPVLEDPQAVRMIRAQRERGECDLGIQLHPWVTPPFEAPAPGTQEGDVSYLTCLDPAVEERKLVALADRFEAAFGEQPRHFRAGRYGLSRSTTGLLEKHGFSTDTSLAPRTNYRATGGPDFSGYECEPFWFGQQRRLLELPLCRSLVGWSGRLAPFLYRAASSPAWERWRLRAILSRLRCAERITLSPEGNDASAMRRLLRHRIGMGQSIFSLSFHSSSLMPGRNPYVRSRADLHFFYDRFSEILDSMAAMGFVFTTPSEMPGLLAGAVP